MQDDTKGRRSLVDQKNIWVDSWRRGFVGSDFGPQELEKLLLIPEILTEKAVKIYLNLELFELYLAPPKFNSSPLKWMVGILRSFWNGLFSGPMLVSGSVLFFDVPVFCVFFSF